MTELSRDDPVREVIDSLDQVGSTTADRLQADGLETVGDVAGATPDDLMALDGVGERRAERVHAAAEDIVSVVPRDVDFDATESVVSEAAIPLSVRNGKQVLVAYKGGSDRTYHTRACATVTYEGSNLALRDWEYVDDHDLDQCARCEDDSAAKKYAEQSGDTSSERDADPLVDSREVILEATLGEKLQVTLAEQDAWASPWTVIETEEPVEWVSAIDGTWHTRRLRLSESASGRDDAREMDIVLGGDVIRIEDPPVNTPDYKTDTRSWRVESVGAVGRVSTTSLIQLQTDDEETDTKPEGDDTWRQYQNRGETA